MPLSIPPLRRMLPGLVALSLALAGAGPCYAQAQAGLKELEHCLRQFDGIDWKLPYQPPVRIRSCEGEAGKGAQPVGHRKLELIGELTLGSARDDLSSDERYAALQAAMFVHFDALFRQRGYRLVGTEQGNARVEYSAYTQCMLAGGGHCVEDAPQAPKPPIPFVSLARYVRMSGAQGIALTYKAEQKNTWSITLDGVPAEGAR